MNTQHTQQPSYQGRTTLWVVTAVTCQTDKSVMSVSLLMGSTGAERKSPTTKGARDNCMSTLSTSAALDAAESGRSGERREVTDASVQSCEYAHSTELCDSSAIRT